MRRLAVAAGTINAGAAVLGAIGHSPLTMWVCTALAAVSFTACLLFVDHDVH